MQSERECEMGGMSAKTKQENAGDEGGQGRFVKSTIVEKKASLVNCTSSQGFHLVQRDDL